MSRPSFDRSPETDALVKFFRKMHKGETVTDAVLSTAVGFDVTEFKANAYRAREIVCRSGDGTVDRVPRVGYTKRDDSAVVRVSAPTYRTKARNAARRGATRLAGVDYDGLTSDDQRSHNTELAYFGAVRMFSGQRALGKVREAAQQTLPPRAVLKLFAK